MPRNQSQFWHGVAPALGSAVLFGASTPAAKALLTAVDPWMTAALLYIGAGIGLAATRLILSACRTVPVDSPLRAKDLPWLAGGVVLSWPGQGAAINEGALLVAIACVCWGIDNNLTRKLSSADPVQIAMIKGSVAGSVNLGLSLAVGAHVPAPSLVLAVGLIGFLGYGISLVLFVAALRQLGTARTGAYFSSAPFVGAVRGIVYLDEPMTWTLATAAGLMAIGLYLHLAERHSHEHVHEPIEHEHGHDHDDHHQHVHAEGETPDARHAHRHRHMPLVHRHAHYPDLHHRHRHL